MRFASLSPLIIAVMLAAFTLVAWAQTPATTKPTNSATPQPSAATPATRPSATPPATHAAAPAPQEHKPAAKPEPAKHEPPKPEQPKAAESHDAAAAGREATKSAHGGSLDYMSMVFVFMLATFIGIGVIRRVSRLLHTPLMSLTNAISAIAVVGAIIVAGGEDYPTGIRILGAIAMFASMTNIISGFLITDRMLKMFKTEKKGGAA